MDTPTKTIFHINWGWGGSSNGYFRLTNLLNFNQGSAVCLLDFEPDYSMAYEDYWTVYSEQDDRGYPSLKMAIDLAPRNESYTIKLLESQEVDPFCYNDGDLTIDLNGKDLIFSQEDPYFAYPWNGVLTITDGSDKRTGTVTNGMFIHRKTAYSMSWEANTKTAVLMSEVVVL